MPPCMAEIFPWKLAWSQFYQCNSRFDVQGPMTPGFVGICRLFRSLFMGKFLEGDCFFQSSKAAGRAGTLPSNSLGAHHRALPGNPKDFTHSLFFDIRKILKLKVGHFLTYHHIC
jgi:hypothetical protein